MERVDGCNAAAGGVAFAKFLELTCRPAGAEHGDSVRLASEAGSLLQDLNLPELDRSTSGPTATSGNLLGAGRTAVCTVEHQAALGYVTHFAKRRGDGQICTVLTAEPQTVDRYQYCQLREFIPRVDSRCSAFKIITSALLRVQVLTSM